MLALRKDLSGEAMAHPDGALKPCPVHGHPLTCVARGRTFNGPGTPLHATTFVVCDLYCKECSPARDKTILERQLSLEGVSVEDLVVVSPEFIPLTSPSVYDHVKRVLKR